MLVLDAVCLNVDRHAGNYGFLARNDTGEVLGLAPLFDHNMALLPHLMEHDDVDERLHHHGPKIGGSFAIVARAMLNANIRARLIALKDFEYEDLASATPHGSSKLPIASRTR